MDNSEIKDLIIRLSAQTTGLITLWGLTNYFDKVSDREIPIYGIRLFGRDLTITTKIFYKMTFFTSSLLCAVNILKLHNSNKIK
jgi:hypothetical protein